MTRSLALRALLVLALICLAGLQYRWAGELAEAERERRLRATEEGSNRFAAELEFEIGRLARLIQGPQPSDDVRAWSIPQGLENWRAGALTPALVSEVYWIREEDDIFRLGADGNWAVVDDAPIWLRSQQARSRRERRPRRMGPLAVLDAGRGIGLPIMNDLLYNRITVVVCEFDREALAGLLETIAGRAFGDDLGINWSVNDEMTTLGASRSNDGWTSTVDRPLLTFESAHRPRQRPRPHEEGPPRGWRLLAGPVALDTGIGAFRVKMIAISSAVLAVLVIALVLLGRSAREARLLADRQLDFVASVSHELRTPLAAIRSAGENLSAGIVSDPEGIKRYGELLEKESRRLDGLVTRVLSMAGMLQAEPQLERREVDLRKLISDTVERCRPALGDSELDLDGLEGDALMAAVDPQSIARAVDNLLLNAARYSPCRPQIRVAVGSAKGEAWIEVSDKGRGLDSAARKKVFEPFWRSPEVIAEGITGTGLGLALVARSVEAHGGRIELESAPGEGSTFRLLLPRRSP